MWKRCRQETRNGVRKEAPPRPGAALLAGAIAIGVNTALLAAADAAGFTTAHGGLLRLLLNIAGWFAAFLGLAAAWSNLFLPVISGPLLQTAFHVIVGLLMAVFYGFVVEPLLRGRAWVKGLLYALAVWLLNALVVLPLIGEGIAGSRHLGMAGMTGFAAAHTIFFLLLSLLYARFGAVRR